MNWKNLKENKCPRCGEYLEWDNNGVFFCQCRFRVSEERMKEIINSQVEEEINKHYERKI